MSPSTYFARKQRPKSARRLHDEELIPLVTAVWEDSGRTYGARRVTRALARAGHHVARCTAERLMRQIGIEGVIRGQRRRTTIPEPAAPRPPDLVNRRFTAERPNAVRPRRREGQGLTVLECDRGRAAPARGGTRARRIHRSRNGGPRPAR
ncbi:IS3 family transposase [Streptomyces sp. NPDC002076]